ncbi:MAG: L,D-transpeptidase family protein [bacterium]
MIRIFALLWVVALAGCSVQSLQERDTALKAVLQQLPITTNQAVVVSNQSWDSTKAHLQRYQRQLVNHNTSTASHWQKVGAAIPVQLGRSGLAWGAGLHQIPRKALLKKEGDGKAPAGIFAFGTAFGYGDRPSGIKLPYRKADVHDYYIDDVQSADYNQWRRLVSHQTTAAKQHWQSFERMRRDDHLYELGLEVMHNKSPVVAGQGSAIFLHLWKTPDTPTAGCTAMDKTNLITVLRWLDPKQQPLLVQMPQQGMKQVKLKP